MFVLFVNPDLRDIYLLVRIVNFFYKNIVCIGVLWWFQIYCAWSAN
jgi:hypothetical protein